MVGEYHFAVLPYVNPGVSGPVLAPPSAKNQRPRAVGVHILQVNTASVEKGARRTLAPSNHDLVCTIKTPAAPEPVLEHIVEGAVTWC